MLQPLQCTRPARVPQYLCDDDCAWADDPGQLDQLGIRRSHVFTGAALRRPDGYSWDTDEWLATVMQVAVEEG